MAAHRYATTNGGWWDRPVSPIIGVPMFLVGFFTLLASILLIVGRLLG